MAKPETERAQGPISFAVDAFVITPNDGADLDRAAYGIMVGGAGDVKLITANGTTITVTVVAGQIIPIIATKVFAADTSATGLIGLV